MLKAAQHDVRSFPQPGETIVKVHTDFRFRMINTISHPAFDVSVAILFRIELRRIRRQPFDLNIPLLRQVSLHNFSPMHRRAIPNQDERSPDPASEMLQSDDQLFSIDGTIEMPLVDLAANAQGHHRRGFAPITAVPFEQRGATHRRPGVGDLFGVRQAKFVFKDDLCADPLRLFLSWASPFATRPGSVLHRAPAPAFPVSAHSSPGCAAAD